jgi:hypothetical protein
MGVNLPNQSAGLGAGSPRYLIKKCPTPLGVGGWLAKKSLQQPGRFLPAADGTTATAKRPSWPLKMYTLNGQECFSQFLRVYNLNNQECFSQSLRVYTLNNQEFFSQPLRVYILAVAGWEVFSWPSRVCHQRPGGILPAIPSFFLVSRLPNCSGFAGIDPQPLCGLAFI